MSGVDDRVVSMQFDNAQFEQHIAETMKSLDSFQQTLKLADSTRGLENVQAAASRFNMGGLADGVEHVSAKFLALATIGLTALSNITSAAMSAGARIIKSLSLDPVMDGFHEYETNMTSIQTILSNTASKGTKLTDVNAALDELNTYSDKTIYNFSEMARNIGTFTAAGVNLDTATQSIKGIANLAALSGSSSEQASTAMYQLSQAIAAGSVKLQDWNSVVNAGMGGEVFQKALFESGKAMGTLKNVPVGQTFEEWKKAGNSFRKSLSDTSDETESTASKIAKAEKDSAEQISNAEERKTEAIENANKRITNARDDAVQVAKSNARDIDDAQKAQSDSAAKNAEAIANAEKNQSEVFTRVAKDIAKAVEEQNQTLAEGAANVQKALDTVTEAQRRLDEAMKPESADKLQAATDRLSTAELDRADLSNAIVLAQRDQQRGAEDLAAARLALAATSRTAAEGDASLIAARRRVEDAETRAADLADAVERARIKQNAATRAVTEAEDQLTEAKKKGTAEDQNVINAQATLEAAEKAVLTAREQAAQKDIAAAQNVQNVELAAEESKKQAVAAVTKARENAATSQVEQAQRIADVNERVAQRQIDATQRVADAEKYLVKVQKDATEAVAKAHESAAARVKAASKDTSKAAEGWLTSKVLTQTLAAFTGDLTEAQLIAQGYTKEQAAELIKLGKIGFNAAQDVKTFTQLMQTVKESIGSGWALTFRTILGDFEQSKKLFTDMNNGIGKVVQTSANLRNAMFKNWADMGGRTLLIKAFGDAIHGLGTIIRPITEAFRDIFPKKTSIDLMRWTKMFASFAENLKIGANTADQLGRGFRGVFAIFEIGWTIVKEFFGLITDLFGFIGGAVGGDALNTFAKMGDYLTGLDRKLVTLGGIHKFFEKLRDVIKNAFDSVQELTDKVKHFFETVTGSKAVEDSVDRIGTRFDTLGKVLDRLSGFYDKVKDVFDKIWGYISNWFSELGAKIAASIQPGDFDSAVDVVNVGLLGGIALMLKKFLTGGGLGDALTGGVIDKLKDVLGLIKKELVGTLQAMQTQLKAKALLEIAIAMGVLTASLAVLSLIDSASLAKALLAMAIGFGQLVGTMELMDKIGGGSKEAGKIGILAGAMIAISSAALILAGAIAILGNLDAAELAKGIAGITGGLAALVVAVKVMAGDSSGVVTASIAMVAMSGALVVLAGAVKLFSTMSWQDMAKGLIGVGAALGLIVLAMNLMPGGVLAGVGLAAAGAGMVLMATGLTIIAGAVKLFSMMSAGDMAKGLIGIAAALLIIAGTMQLMPLTLPITAAGMLILSVALNSMAGAVAIMGSMKLGTLAKGIGGLAAMLIVLAIGVTAMDSAMPGALALVVASVGLTALAEVILKLSKLSIKELVMGLGAMAATIAILGLSALILEPLIPAMLGLGVAMGILGLSFALFGIGAISIAKAFEIMAKSGTAGIGAIIDAIGLFIKAIPKFVASLITSLVESADQFLQAGTLLIKLATVFLGQLLDTIIELAPKIALAIVAIVTAALKLIREKIPDIIETGFVVLEAFLKGVLDHMDKVVQMAIDITIKFATILRDNADKLVNAGIDLLTAFLKAFADRAGDIAGAGLTILLGLIKGAADNIVKVIDLAGSIVSNLITAIGKAAGDIVAAGANAVVKFVEGLGKDSYKVINAGVALLVSLMEGVSSNALYVANKGAQIIIDFVNGIANTIRDKEPKLIAAFFNLADAMIEGLIEGIKQGAKKIGGPFGSVLGGIIDFAYDKFKSHSPSRVFLDLGKSLMDGLGIGVQKDKSAKSAVVTQAENIVNAFAKTLGKIPDSLSGMDELNPVITPVLDLTKVQAGAKGLNDLMKVSIRPDISLDNARVISASTSASSDSTGEVVSVGPSEIKFEQNIYAPEALSTNDIYRNTKSQIVMAKEELNIP